MNRWKNLDKANVFLIENKCLDINSDKKRKWNRDFDDLNDVLNSTISSKTIHIRYVNLKSLH